MTRATDVLELYGLDAAATEAVSLGPTADALLQQLRDSARTADELVRASGIDPDEGAAAALMELELAGRVTLEDGGYRPAV